MDSEVPQLLLDGQRDRAFEKIVALYANKVFRLVLSLIGDAARAEEVSQDVFVKIWQAMDVFDPKRAAVGTWVYRIAHNTALTHLRAESYRQTLPMDSVAEPQVSAAEPEGIRHLVEQLPEELREVSGSVLLPRKSGGRSSRHARTALRDSQEPPFPGPESAG